MQGSIHFPLVRVPRAVGPTGCGKTRLLRALEREGNQVLDLEHLRRIGARCLAASLASPSRRRRRSIACCSTSCVSSTPAGRSGSRPKARKSATCSCPMRCSMRCGAAARCRSTRRWTNASLLLGGLSALRQRPRAMVEKLAPLKPIVGGDELALWKSLARPAGGRAIERLLITHYDRSYRRSRLRSPFGCRTLYPDRCCRQPIRRHLAEAASDLTRRFGRTGPALKLQRVVGRQADQPPARRLDMRLRIALPALQRGDHQPPPQGGTKDANSSSTYPAGRRGEAGAARVGSTVATNPDGARDAAPSEASTRLGTGSGLPMRSGPRPHHRRCPRRAPSAAGR